MFSGIITTIYTAILTLSGTSLCCHTHADGSPGCWPANASNVDCEYTIACPGEAGQTNPDDEESWVCNGAPRS